MTANYCEAVFDIMCKAPPYEDDSGPKTRATCFACGLPVCTSCSVITKWYGYGRRRVCTNCLGTHGLEHVVEKLARRHAGYE